LTTEKAAGISWRLLFFAAAIPAGAQTTDFSTWAFGIARNQLNQRKSIISSIQTVQAAEQRRAWVRGRLAQIFGTLPVSTAPLKVQITVQIQQAGFQIQTVIFQSSPG